MCNLGEKMDLQNIEKLSKAKKDLLLKILAEKRKKAMDAGKRIPAKDHKGTRIPLSYVQERFWFTEKLHPGTIMHNIAGAATISGDLDIDLLIEGFNAVTLKHDILRSSFPEDENGAYINISDDSTFEYQIVDCRSLPELDRKKEALKHIKSRINTPFDINNGPLWSVIFCQLDNRTWFVGVVLNHIIADGTSTSILFQETIDYYLGRLKSEDMKLKSLDIQYQDFTYWQRDEIENKNGKEDLEFWKNHLEDGEFTLSLLNPNNYEKGITRLPFHIPLNKVEQIKEYAKREKVTPFVLLLSVLYSVIFRLSGQEDICVGVPVAGRNHVDLSPLIGCFINTLPVRRNIDPEISFRMFLNKTRVISSEVFKHQSVPFERLVADHFSERNMELTPFCQILFSYEDSPNRNLNVPGFEIKFEELDSDATRFEIELEVNNDVNGYTGWFHFNRAMFTNKNGEILKDCFISIIDQVLENPKVLLKDLNIVSPKSKQLLEKFYGEEETPKDRGIFMYDFLVEQAKSTPEKVAIVFNNTEYSYEWLNSESNRIAWALRDRGITSNTPVGVCMNRTPEMIATIYGILKSGGYYIPLDPNYPIERLSYILEQTNTEIIVATNDIINTNSLLCSEKYLSLETLLNDEKRESNLDKIGSTDQLAYIIYTSGSTGNPKGVAVCHKTPVEQMLWGKQLFNTNELSRVLGSTSINFDTSILEIFFPISVGGAIVLVENALVLTSGSFTTEITLINTVPSVMAEIIRHDVDLSNVLVTNLCGEPLKQKLVNEIYKTGIKKVYDLYGPTEDTVYTTAALRELNGIETIGKSLPGERTYVLDKYRKEVPPGMKGELYISGSGLSKGYFNRPDLTNEVFVPDPFSKREGALMYKTGDEVRFLTDGTLQFIGRLDNQVKLRGFRIELGEIENVILNIEGIDGAVVLVQVINGEKHLIAYVTGNYNEELVHEVLSNKLTTYMIPSSIIHMDEFPYTISKKINKKALPIPEIRDDITEVLEPESELEITLWQIWSDILGTEKFGTLDNFFSIGGHSLLATQVVSRVQKDLGKDLTLISFFENSTIKKLSEVLDSIEDSTYRSINRKNASDDIPLSFAQERLWFLHQYGDNGSSMYNIPFVLNMKGKLDVDKLKSSFKSVITRHESLRTVFKQNSNGSYQTILNEFDLPIEVLNWKSVNKDFQEIELGRVAKEQAKYNFDLEDEIGIKALLVQISDDEHYLIITLNHIISDGWSVGVLVDEIVSLYSGKELQELNIQFSDYVYWEKEEWESGRLELEVENTIDRLSTNELPILEFPTDHSRPIHQNFDGAVLFHEYDIDLKNNIKDLSVKYGVTEFIVMIASFQILLSKYSGQDQIIVGTPVSGRTQKETENLIGFFVNTLVLSGDLSNNPVFSDYLNYVKKDVLGAYENQRAPFEMVVEKIGIERDLSRSPLFQVMFAMQNTPDESMELENLSVNLLETDNGGSKFDFSFYVEILNDRIKLRLEYATALFQPKTMETLAIRWGELLDSIIKNPELKISEYNILSKQDHDQISEWTGEETTLLGDNILLHELVSKQAKNSPDEVAIEWNNESYTYRWLEEQSNRVGWSLIDRGIGPDITVGVLKERTPELIITILGILKAGGAYIPLDPQYPNERIEYIIKETNSPIIICDELIKDIEVEHSSLFITLDELVEGIDNCSDIPRRCNNSNLAYIIYTSGSTGKPKGVAINHSSPVELVFWSSTVYSKNEYSKVLASTSINFDISIFEIFVPLSFGGCILLVENALELINPKLNLNPTLINTVPSVAKELVKLNGFNKELQVLNLAGELLKQNLVDDLYSIGVPKVFDLYGPSEDTTYSTYTLRTKDGIENIGRPITGTRAYILDKFLNPVLPGAKGELYLGGNGLARGYFGQEELTRERFIPDKFSRYKDKKMYKTGDECMFLPDGTIKYIGRLDHQVKIKGFRIELGEIENSIISIPGISEVLVIVKELNFESKIIAYYTGNITEDVIIDNIEKKLAYYMIPNVFMKLERFPLTANKKIDRNSLPEPITISSAKFEEPANEQEQIIVDIFEELLNYSPIGRNDNFFKIGGDSILSMQVVSRLSNKGYTLSVRDLFENPVVSYIASNLIKKEIRLYSDSEKYGESFPVGIVNEFSESLKENVNHFHQAVLVEFNEAIDEESLKQAIEFLVRKHDSLRLRWNDSTKMVQINKFESCDISIKTNYINDNLLIDEDIKNETMKRINIQEGPTSAFSINKNCDGKYSLLMAVHHFGMDGVSWRILLDEILESYINTKKGLSLEHTDFIGVPYLFWMQSLQEYSDTIDVLEEENFWNEYLVNDIKSLPIGDNTKSNLAKYRESTIFKLDYDSSNEFIENQKNLGEGLIEHALVHTFGWILSDEFNEDIIRVELERHGREGYLLDLDLSQTMGWFTVLHPVIINFSSNQNFIDSATNTVQNIKSIPNRGFNYPVLKHLTESDYIDKKIKQDKRGNIVINYLGTSDFTSPLISKVSTSEKDTGSILGPTNNLLWDWEINARIESGSLEIEWIYSSKRYDKKYIEDLSIKVLDRLEELSQNKQWFTFDTTENNKNNSLELGIEEMDDILAQLS